MALHLCHIFTQCGPCVQAKGPLNASLSDHFFAKFRRGSQECKAAQRAFAESMAAYSLVCYLLQIKVGAQQQNSMKSSGSQLLPLNSA